MNTMSFSIQRKRNKFASGLPMDVFVNGSRVSSIFEGETRKIEMDTDVAKIQVRFNGIFSSNEVHIDRSLLGKTILCGAKRWTAIDILSIKKHKKLRSKTLKLATL